MIENGRVDTIEQWIETKKGKISPRYLRTLELKLNAHMGNDDINRCMYLLAEKNLERESEEFGRRVRAANGTTRTDPLSQVLYRKEPVIRPKI